MKIKITKSTLIDLLNKVQRVAHGKSTIQILQNVKLTAEEGKLTATCTNLDMTIVSDAKCEVMEAGETTLPVKMLAGIVSKVADVPVVIDVNGVTDRAEISAGTASFKLCGMSAEDFPKVEKPTGTSVNVSSPILRDMLMKVKYAAATDDTRHKLQSVLLEVSGAEFCAVATDGRRLARFAVPLPSDMSYAQILIPIETVETICAILKGDETCTIIFNNTKLYIEGASYCLFAKLIDEAYPNYKAIIPEKLDESFTLERNDFITSLERVVCFASDGNTSVVTLGIEPNQMMLTASSTDVGEARDTVPIKYSGHSDKIRLNPTFMSDVLKALDDDEVEIKYNTGSQPIVLTKNGGDFTYVVMPLRI